MKVLVACEYSGEVRRQFVKRGHDVWSADLLPHDDTDGGGAHYQGPVENILMWPWDLMIAHPPCTYLSNSGVCHLHADKSRWAKMIDGAVFFRMLLLANIKKKCIENPIMHGYGKKIIGRGQDQIVHPWMFGHPEQKATCLWLDGVPPLKETDNVKEEMLALPKNERERIHYLPPSKDRWKERSKTFTGLAIAMAEQWG